MLSIEFKGAPYLFTGDSLDEDGALTTPETFARGEASYAHYYPQNGGIVRRYRDTIGTRADITVFAIVDAPKMDLCDLFVALDNMLGGDPNWRR